MSTERARPPAPSWAVTYHRSPSGGALSMVSWATAPGTTSSATLSYTYTVAGYSPTSKPKESPRFRGELSAFRVPLFRS